MKIRLSFDLMLLTILLMGCIPIVSNGQLSTFQAYDLSFSNDSISSRNILKRSIIPVALITSGAILSQSSFEKKLQTNLRNSVGNEFRNRIDDYFQYVPIAEMYLADVIGIRARNHWFDQTKYLFLSNLVTSIFTHSLKRIIGKTRPSGSSLSMPSGHTSFAFTNAAVLFNEFEDHSKMLAFSGYAFAATTGLFRMLNNKHWISDVLVGAGLGILITEVIYHFEPFKKFNPFKKSSGITFLPNIRGKEYGFNFSIQLQ